MQINIERCDHRLAHERGLGGRLMNYRLTKRMTGMLLATFVGVLGLSGAALAHGGSGGGGHGAVGGGRFSGGGHFAGGGYRSEFGGHPGYRGDRGAVAWRGGRGGYHGGYGWHGGYGGWGWGGLGVGLYFATLPYYYSTFWNAGVPYYYADDNYYQWDSSLGQYETVNPPPDVQRQAEQASNLIAYPKNGQAQAQQAADKADCSTWAASQSGFDPTHTSTTESVNKHSDYMRAQAACLEGRGYSVQ